MPGDRSAGYEALEDVSVEHHDCPDNRGQRDGVPKHKPENAVFRANLIRGCSCDTDGLRVDHFAHHAAGAVRRAHQNRV